ncbi:hypothetical protein H6P81_012787 [Aristolochia fimbriata]|uniref:Remorin C-terminal domain-containing protein n=1 Tax=Aristolochia fimbriata TaxID=158543 RepID=A0AAV7ED65_ARIFI|nr:hypothetical protein H6P81_012787 [Aristolochia fimbriata]
MLTICIREEEGLPFPVVVLKGWGCHCFIMASLREEPVEGAGKHEFLLVLRSSKMMRSVEDKGCYVNGGGLDNTSSGTNACSFEFHKGNGTSSHRSAQRQILGGRSKHTPSKWDDAQKWLAGLSGGGGGGADHGHGKSTSAKPRNSNAEDRRLIAPQPHDKGKDYSGGSSTDEGADDVRTEIPNQEEGETKKIDCNESFWRINKPMEEDSLCAVRSVCVRDMGTEMTPIASQEPSRTATPLRATTPALRSPISSRSSTPGRVRQGSQGIDYNFQTPGLNSLDGRNHDHQKNPGLGGSRPGGHVWQSREDRDEQGVLRCKVVENDKSEQGRKPTSLENRAMAWDEAERAKYMARYKREEVKIQAWENHQKRKAELEMRKTEVKAERLKSRAQEKLANKLAATRRIAEEKRANAEAKLNEQAVKTSERADYIRRTGHLPSSFSLKLPSFCW